MPSDLLCPCEDIRQWQQTHGSRTGWSALGPVAYFLWRRKSQRWKIKPANQLSTWAEKGCGTCLLLCRAISTLLPLDKLLSVRLRLSNVVCQLEVTVKFLQNGAKAKQRFYIYHPQGYGGYEPFGPNSLRAPEQPRPGHLAYNTDAAMSRIRWTGGASSDGSYAPTRLLCVNLGRGQQNPNDTNVNLVEPLPSFSSPYVALSHCWGQRGHVTTTRANYASRQSGIPMCELPKTFQDAVWVTRKLGIGYIWIDSLCIVQDDPQDWEREAADMSRLYGAAYVTLAASHGTDGSAGLFPEATEGQHALLDIDMPLPPGGGCDKTTVSVNVMVMPRLDENSQVHKAYGTDDVSPAEADVLQTRGWVLQERVLSAVVIHFNAQELVMEWNGRTICECGAVSRQSMMTNLMGSPYHRERGSDVDESDADDMRLEVENPIWSYGDDYHDESRMLDLDESTKIWSRLVETFTSRALTKPNDRTAAFAGIAQTYQKLLDTDKDSIAFRYTGDYCAGLWQANLPDELMWSCSTGDLFSLQPLPQYGVNGSRSGRITDARAPSWSWCSVTGPCTMVSGKCEEKYGISLWSTNTCSTSIKYAYKSNTGSPFGHLQEARLTIQRAALCKATRPSVDVAFTLLSGNAEQRPSTASKIHISFDDEEEARQMGEIFLLPLLEGRHDWLHIWLEFQPPDALSGDELQRWIYEVYYPQVSGNEPCREHHFGVALARIDSVADNRYRRLGIFHMRGPFCANMELRHEEWSIKEKPEETRYAQEFADSLQWEDNVVLV